MAGPPAPVGDNRSCPFHNRFPVGVGHVGDQHLTGYELVHGVHRLQHPDPAGADLLPDRPAFDQRGARRLIRYRCTDPAGTRDCTVSGRACRM